MIQLAAFRSGNGLYNLIIPTEGILEFFTSDGL